MVQWVKNPTSVVFVIAKVLVQSLSQLSVLKDVELPQLQHGLNLLLRFDPCPGTSICCKFSRKYKTKKRV